MTISFVALIPVSFRMAQAFFFTRPFNEALPNPLLLVCPTHVEIFCWHDLGEGRNLPAKGDCTYQIVPQRQAWVETAVRNLQRPVPQKASWTIDVQQLSVGRQRIALQLMGDGVEGMIYEVQDGKVNPTKTRVTGPAGAIFIFPIHLLLWSALWALFWSCKRLSYPQHAPELKTDSEIPHPKA